MRFIVSLYRKLGRYLTATSGETHLGFAFMAMHSAAALTAQSLRRLCRLRALFFRSLKIYQLSITFVDNREPNQFCYRWFETSFFH